MLFLAQRYCGVRVLVKDPFTTKKTIQNWLRSTKFYEQLDFSRNTHKIRCVRVIAVKCVAIKFIRMNYGIVDNIMVTDRMIAS